MPIRQEVSFMATPERVYQIPAADQRIPNSNPAREQEQKVEDLRTEIENLQQTVCELLLKNQILRMALDRDRESVTTSSATGFSNGHFREFR
jgi:hypothetical protein